MGRLPVVFCCMRGMSPPNCFAVFPGAWVAVRLGPASEKYSFFCSQLLSSCCGASYCCSLGSPAFTHLSWAELLSVAQGLSRPYNPRPCAVNMPWQRV